MNLTQNCIFGQILVPKLKFATISIKFGTQSKLKKLIINILLEIENLGTKLQIWANLVTKLKCAPILMKFGMQNKRNMLIIKKQLKLITLTQHYKFGQIWSQN